MLSPFQKMLIRLTFLFMILLVLLAVFVLKKDEENLQLEAEKKRQIEADVRRFGFHDRKLRDEKPLDYPDFGSGSVALYQGDFQELSQDLYQSAKNAQEEVKAFKLKKAGETLNAPINLTLLESSSTAQEFNEKYLKFRLRELKAYCEFTMDKEAVKEAGEKFLHAYLFNVTRQPDSLSDAELFQLAKEVNELGSKDPLLSTYLAYVLYRATGDSNAAEIMWTDCIEKLRRSRYPFIVRVYLRSLVADCKLYSHGRTHALLVSIIRWLEIESKSEQWKDCIHHKLANIWKQNHSSFRNQLLVGCLKSPKIDPFIKHWLVGVRFVEKAWETRGKRLAKNMDWDEYNNFKKNLNIAKVHLEYAYLLRPNSPFPPYKMLSVTLDEEANDYKSVDWFRRSVENRFDYSPAYYSVLYSMLPRWGGSIDQNRNFAQQCIDSDRFDTHVPYFVIDILQYLLKREFDNDCEQLKRFGANKIIDDFLAKRAEYRETHPGEKLYGDTAYYRTKLGMFFEKLGRPQDAIAEYKAAEGDLDFYQLQYGYRLGKFLLCRLFAAQGEFHDRVIQFDKELRKLWPPDTDLSEIDQLEKEWQELKPTAKDEMAKRYFAHTGVILEQLKAYYQGDWVDLSFRDKGLGWEIRSEKIDWNNQDHSVLSCRETIQSNSSWARPLVNFEAPFQVQAYVEQIAPYPGSTRIKIRLAGFNMKDNGKTEDKPNLYVGIHGRWSYPKSKISNEFRDSEELTCSFQVCSLNPGMKWNDCRYLRTMKKGMHLIDWKIRKHANELTLGNYPDFVRFDDPAIQRFHLIFSSDSKSKSYRLPCTSEFVWKLKNVRIRRVSTEDLPSDETPIEARTTYWEQRVKNDPDDIVARLKLCEAYWDHGLADQLLDQSNDVLARWPELEKIRQYQGLALYKLGRYQEAMVALELAMKEYRESIDVIMAAAEIKAASNDEVLRDRKESLSLAKFGKSCSTSHRIEFKATHWAALAIAYAENNFFDKAIEANQEAMTLAKGELKTELQDRQKLFEAATAYHYPTGK